MKNTDKAAPTTEETAEIAELEEIVRAENSKAEAVRKAEPEDDPRKD